MSARDENGNLKNMGSMTFRTKYLPKPFVEFHDVRGSGTVKKNVVPLIEGLNSSYEDDFIFQLAPPNIVSFKMVVRSGIQASNPRSNNGAKFNESIKARLDNIRAGEIIEFTNIIVRGKDGRKVEADNISVRVIN